MLHWMAAPVHSKVEKPLSTLTTNFDALLTEIAKRDNAALQTLYDLCGQQVYSLAYAITRNRETAEEVTQDVFLKVWNRVALYERGTNFRAWLLKLTRNQAIDRLRRDQPDQQRTSIWDLEETSGGTSLPDENARWLVEALRHHLNEGQRQAIELAFIQGMTHQQIADTLHVPLGTIKTRIRDGLQKLREAWEMEHLAS